MKSLIFLLFIATSIPTFGQKAAPDSYAVLKTSMGNIRIKLYRDQAPDTVTNFVGLAKGIKDFKDVRTGKTQTKTAFYKNLIFHRTHPKLGISTGCPWGTGHGWPGFTIAQELQPEMKFDRPFLVGMSAIPKQPNSAGSQFFITTEAMPHINGKYAIFGEVIEGFEVVKKISKVRHDAMMKPIKDVLLKETIIE